MISRYNECDECGFTTEIPSTDELTWNRDFGCDNCDSKMYYDREELMLYHLNEQNNIIKDLVAALTRMKAGMKLLESREV